MGEEQDLATGVSALLDMTKSFAFVNKVDRYGGRLLCLDGFFLSFRPTESDEGVEKSRSRLAVVLSGLYPMPHVHQTSIKNVEERDESHLCASKRRNVNDGDGFYQGRFAL